MLVIDTENTHVKQSSSFINNGILAYQKSVFIPGVANNEIIIRPSSVACPPISNAFALGGVINLNFLGVFSDQAGTISAGTYNQNNNTFTANPPLADGVTTTLYVSIEDQAGNGCTRIVPWLVTVDDTTPPTFDCPSAMTVNMTQGSCQGLVPNFSTMVSGISDDCGSVTISQDITANSTFGTNDGDQITVTVTADDGKRQTPILIRVP